MNYDLKGAKINQMESSDQLDFLVKQIYILITFLTSD